MEGGQLRSHLSAPGDGEAKLGWCRGAGYDTDGELVIPAAEQRTRALRWHGLKVLVVVAAGAMLLLAAIPAEHAREDLLSAVLSMSVSPPSSHYKSSLSALPASVASCIDPAVDP